MKRTVAFCFLSAAFAHGALAAIPESAKGWYTPSEFEVTTSYGTVMYQDDYGVEYAVTIMIDEDANFIEVDGSGSSRLDVLSEASMNALQALVKATRNTERIETIGKNLDSVFRAEGIKMEMEKQGPGGSSTRVTYTMRINPGSNGGAASIEASDPTPYGGIVDGKTIAWTAENASGQLQLYNAKTATDSTEGWWDDYGFVVPYLKGNNNLGWKKFGGIDSSVLDRVDSTTAGGARLLTLYGWYRTSGNCTAPLSVMLTTDDATQQGNRQNHFLLAQYTGGQTPELHYVPIGDLMPGGGAPVDGKSVTTNETDGASAQGVASLYGWAGDVEENAETLTQMLSDGSSEGRSNNYVLARVGTGDDAYLAYLPIGEGLDGVTWATNWTEAVEHITKEETIQIVSFVTNSWTHENFITNTWNHENFITNTWNHENFITNTWNHENFITNTWNHENFITNAFSHETFITNTWNHENFITNAFTHENFITNTWNHENFITNMWTHENFLTNVVNHENFITNVIDAYSTISNFHDFVTFQTNSYERLHTIENWNYVTNFIVRYLGGMDSGGDGGGGSGGGEDTGPTIAPEDDPYSEEYIPEKIDDYLLPVKNARNIVAITNQPFAMLDATKMLDFQSVNTNKEHLAQLYGFDEAQTGTTPVKESDGEGGYRLEWVEHPAALLAITTNGIAEIRQWMVKNNVTNIFTSVVSNSEAVATMRTNLFAHVKAETLLDNESVWTNGTRRVEIKGFKTAPLYTVPYIDYSQSTYEANKDREIIWERLPFADGDAGPRFGVSGAPHTICSTTSGTADSDGTFKMLSLYGFEDAEDGQVPKKNGSAIEWVYAFTPDEASITTNTSDSVAALYGFGNAADNMIPHKENGKLVWGGISAVTNTILAGAGINITDNGGGAITISAKPYNDTNEVSSVSVVTDVRYDATSHKFQAKRRVLTFRGSLSSETDWEDVFDAVSHASQHQSGGNEP